MLENPEEKNNSARRGEECLGKPHKGGKISTI